MILLFVAMYTAMNTITVLYASSSASAAQP